MNIRARDLTALACAAALLALSGTAFAGTIKITGNAAYRAGSGGEFTVEANDAAGALELGSAVARGYVAGANGTSILGPTSLQTFCLEFTQYITLPGTYDFAISDGAKSGGNGGDGSIDRISIGTAYLYSSFATGNLAGYNYTPGAAARALDAVILQNAIWYLEHEISLDAAQIAANKFLSGAAGALTIHGTNARNDNNGVYGVGVLNLGAPPGFSNQDQLILVPDGGTTLALLGGALMGLGMLRRKYTV